MLQRANRDGVIAAEIPDEPADNEAIFLGNGPLALSNRKIVLEEYCLSNTSSYPVALAQELANLIPDDDLFQTISDRLVILSNGVMSHFATTTCEIAQHVRISDETGTAIDGGLFNQENVPSDTLFYTVLNAVNSRVPHSDYSSKTEQDAIKTFKTKIKEVQIFQFGGDSSTGLGFCSVVDSGSGDQASTETIATS